MFVFSISAAASPDEDAAPWTRVAELASARGGARVTADAGALDALGEGLRWGGFLAAAGGAAAFVARPRGAREPGTGRKGASSRAANARGAEANVIVAQPRRVAAVSVARRVAETFGETHSVRVEREGNESEAFWEHFEAGQEGRDR